MNIRKILIAGLLATASLAALAVAGCSGKISGEETVKDAGAFNQQVTYYANGGMFNGQGSLSEKNLYFQANTPVISDFDSVINISIERSGYEFNGWHYVETDSDGLPVKDADGNVVVSDTAVDFSVFIQANEHWYIAATWLPVMKVEIKLATDDGGSVTADDGTVYENGSVINTTSFQNGVAIMDTTVPLKCSGYTFTQLFHDPECTLRVTGNINRPEEEGAENPVVYAQYLKGEWEVVRNASGVEEMLFAPGGKNYWICTMAEEKVIDCSSISISLRQNAFSGRVEGNGYTLKGITVTQASTNRDGLYSLFGPLNSTSTVRNLTIEDLSVSVTSAQSVSVYLISSSVSGAVLENINIINANLKITAQNEIYNIRSTADGYETDNWLFGGVEGADGNETDEAFLAVYSGVTVEGGSFTINGFEYTRENTGD